MEEVLIEALSASMGGIISSSALFPLEVVKTKMQAMDSKKDKKKEEKGQDGGDGEEVRVNLQSGKELITRCIIIAPTTHHQHLYNPTPLGNLT